MLGVVAVDGVHADSVGPGSGADVGVGVGVGVGVSAVVSFHVTAPPAALST